MRRRVFAFICSVCMICAVLLRTQEVQAATVTVKVDGDPSEWVQMPSYWSNTTAIAKWSMAQDDEFYYFYMQERNVNEYGHPGLQSNNFVIGYEDKSADKAKKLIQTNGRYVKDGIYADIAGAEITVGYYDWQAVGMTMVGNGAVDKVAMVFDGDVYIYISMRVPWERRHRILSLISAKRRRQASVRAGSLR